MVTVRKVASEELELEAFFAGALSGASGLRSWLGPMIENGGRAVPSTASPPEPGGEALAAVRTDRRIRETLLEMDLGDRAVLAAAFTPQPPGLLEEHIVQLGGLVPLVQLLEGHEVLDAVLALARRRGHPCRRNATGELRRMQASARRALQRALEAYARAGLLRRERLREERLARWETGS